MPPLAHRGWGGEEPHLAPSPFLMPTAPPSLVRQRTGWSRDTSWFPCQVLQGCCADGLGPLALHSSIPKWGTEAKNFSVEVAEDGMSQEDRRLLRGSRGGEHWEVGSRVLLSVGPGTQQALLVCGKGSVGPPEKPLLGPSTWASSLGTCRLLDPWDPSHTQRHHVPLSSPVSSTCPCFCPLPPCLSQTTQHKG